MLLCDITNQFLDGHRFTDASATEEANLAALNKRNDEVDRFNTCLKNFSLRGLFVKTGRRSMNRELWRLCINRTFTVDGVAEHVKKPAERRLTDRHRDWFTS